MKIELTDDMRRQLSAIRKAKRSLQDGVGVMTQATLKGDIAKAHRRLGKLVAEAAGEGEATAIVPGQHPAWTKQGQEDADALLGRLDGEVSDG